MKTCKLLKWRLRDSMIIVCAMVIMLLVIFLSDNLVYEDFESSYLSSDTEYFYETIDGVSVDIPESETIPDDGEDEFDYEKATYYSAISQYIIYEGFLIALFTAAIFIGIAMSQLKDNKYKNFLASMPYTRNELYISAYLQALIAAVLVYVTEGIALTITCGSHANAGYIWLGILNGILKLSFTIAWLELLAAKLHEYAAIGFVAASYVVFHAGLSVISRCLYVCGLFKKESLLYKAMFLKDIYNGLPDGLTLHSFMIEDLFFERTIIELDEFLAISAIFGVMFILLAIATLLWGTREYRNIELSQGIKTYKKPHLTVLFSVCTVVVSYVVVVLIFGAVYTLVKEGIASAIGYVFSVLLTDGINTVLHGTLYSDYSDSLPILRPYVAVIAVMVALAGALFVCSIRAFQCLNKAERMISHEEANWTIG